MPPPSGTGKPARRNDADWLTVLAMLTVFLFHCARFFNHEDWHVKSNHLDHGMSLFVAIVAQWVMPLFFVLSGTSSYHSLNARSIAAYLRNRLRRLAVPLVFGIFVVLAPVQVWIERVSHGQFDGSFIGFYPRYFSGWYGFGGNFAWMGLHRWYLEMLLVFTLLTLPFFRFMTREGIQHRIAGAAGFFSKPGAILLFAAPLLPVEWLVAHLGWGSRCLDFDNRILKHSREAVLPFYVLHQPVIVVIGFTIASWKTGMLSKYIVLSTFSFVLIMAFYELLVKRIRVLRLLFGMKVTPG